MIRATIDCTITTPFSEGSDAEYSSVADLPKEITLKLQELLGVKCTRIKLHTSSDYSKPKKGPHLTTGRFATRRELEARVRFLWGNNGMSIEKIGKSCGISSTTVENIMKQEQAK